MAVKSSVAVAAEDSPPSSNNFAASSLPVCLMAMKPPVAMNAATNGRKDNTMQHRMRRFRCASVAMMPTRPTVLLSLPSEEEALSLFSSSNVLLLRSGESSSLVSESAGVGMVLALFGCSSVMLIAWSTRSSWSLMMLPSVIIWLGCVSGARALFWLWSLPLFFRRESSGFVVQVGFGCVEI